MRLVDDPASFRPDAAAASTRPGPVSGFLALIRAPATVTQGVLVVLLARCYAEGAPRTADLLLAGLAYLLVSAAGFTVNDVFDRDIDAINKPRRPIPAGAIGVPTAVTMFVAFLVGSMLCALQLGGPFAALTIANGVLITAYSAYFKRHGGLLANVLMGVYATLLVLSGAVAGGGPLSARLVVGCSALFLYMVGNQIVMGVEDLEGDRRQGARTLPVTLGVRPALAIAAGWMVPGLVALGATYRSRWELGPMLGIAALNVVLLVRLLRAPTPATAARGRVLMAVSMILMVVIYVSRGPCLLGPGA